MVVLPTVTVFLQLSSFAFRNSKTFNVFYLELSFWRYKFIKNVNWSPLCFRCILAKKFSPQNWKVMTLMEQHKEERQKDPFYFCNYSICIQNSSKYYEPWSLGVNFNNIL